MSKYVYVNWLYITAVCVSTMFIIFPSKCDGHMHAWVSKVKWSASEDDNTNQLKMQSVVIINDTLPIQASPFILTKTVDFTVMPIIK